MVAGPTAGSLGARLRVKTSCQSCCDDAVIVYARNYGFHCDVMMACHMGIRRVMQAVFPTYNRDTQLYGHATMRAQWTDNGRIEANFVLEVRSARVALEVYVLRVRSAIAHCSTALELAAPALQLVRLGKAG
eukprot:1161659-Pelagomonas_calceolata.AAC.19